MRKYLKGVQVFACIVLCCTIIMWIALWASSAVPGSQSGKDSSKVTAYLNDKLGLSDKINKNLTTYQIGIGVRNHKSVYYTSDTAETYVSYKPSETMDRDVNYYTSNKNIATVDEDGNVTFNGGIGTVYVYAQLRSDESIQSYVTMRCYGENPFDSEYPERLNFKYINSTGDVSNPVVGERRQIVLNDGKSDLGLVKVSSEDEDILFYWRGYLYGRKEGETNLIIEYKDGEEEKTIIQPVTVGAGTIPDIEFELKENLSYIHGNRANKFTLMNVPNGQEEKYDCIVESSNNTIVSLSGTTWLYMNGIGSATLTYTSCYDPTITAEVDVDVLLNPPKTISITGSNTLVAHGADSYTVNISPINYSNETTWSVVSGPGEIDSNGMLTATGYGKIVIRCTSNIDESLYCEKEIDVKLFISAHGFVRKLMGHAGLSAVLGFGIFATLYILLKRKYLIVTSIPLCYIYAFVSELIQKYTPDRYASYNDVFIDFAGTLVGIAVAIVLVVLINVLWLIIDKKSYRKFKEACKVVNFKTLFSKTAKLELAYDNMHIAEPEGDTVELESTTTVLSNENISTDLISDSPLAVDETNETAETENQIIDSDDTSNE